MTVSSTGNSEAILAHGAQYEAAAQHHLLPGLKVAGQPTVVLLAQVRRNDQLGGGLPERLGARVAKGALGGRVELANMTARIDGDDAIRRRIQNGPHARLTGSQGAFGGLALRIRQSEPLAKLALRRAALVGNARGGAAVAIAMARERRFRLERRLGKRLFAPWCLQAVPSGR